jgi:hypothetical protein
MRISKLLPGIATERLKLDQGAVIERDFLRGIERVQFRNEGGVLWKQKTRIHFHSIIVSGR